MLYVDDFGRESLEKPTDKVYCYIDECSYGIQSEKDDSGDYIFNKDRKTKIDIIDLETLRSFEMYDETILIASRTRYEFKNNFVTENGKTLLKNVDKINPFFFKFRDFTILHSINELYVGFDKHNYARMYLDDVKDGKVLKVDGCRSNWSSYKKCTAIGFPRVKNGFYSFAVPVLHSYKGYKYKITEHDVADLFGYTMYSENVDEFLKLRSVAMKRQYVLRG